MTISFIDLQSQFLRLEDDIRSAINGVLEHRQFILGPEVAELEEKLAQFAGVKYAISCSSGTDALLMPLLAYGVGPGDAVFTTPFTFVATAEVIALTGATPIFVDLDPVTFNIDPTRLETAIQRVRDERCYRPRGIIPVDLFGLPADYDAIMSLADQHGLFVLEDAAQGFGGTYHGRPAGCLGHVGATSFFPAKPLGCYGDGGAVFTDDEELASSLLSIRVHGQGQNKYDNIRIGLNARLDTLQAAILLPKLNIFPQELTARQWVSERYSTALQGIVTTPTVPAGLTRAWAQYSVLSERRADILTALAAAGVPSAIYYPKPLHLQGAFSALGHKRGDFPVAEHIAERIFSLPMHAYLNAEQIDSITAIIRKAVR